MRKIALISGSTAGSGDAIAAALAREGVTVIVNGRLQGAVDAAVAKLKPAASAAVFGIAANLSTAVAANLVARQFPDVETVINNLGIFEPKPFKEIPDGDWMRLFEVNVLSAVRLARLYLPGMKRNN